MKKADFEFILSVIEEELGWSFGDKHYAAIDAKISSFLREKEIASIDELITRVRRNDRLLIEQLGEALTLTDTAFFRDYDVFYKFKTLVLPKIKEAYKSIKRMNIWSCGCSSGQEVYSILILLKEAGLLEDWQVCVVGTDYCSKSLAQASKGFYNNYDVQTGLNINQILENFVQKDNGWKVKPELALCSEFRKFNLLKTPLLKRKFDIVFCRNTIKYYNVRYQEDIIKKIYSTQNAGGLLYVGINENFAGLETYYDKIIGFDCLYQARKKPLEKGSDFL